MFDWFYELQEYFNQLGEDMNTLVADIQTLVDNLNTYITFSTYYIYISGFAILILIIMCAAMLGKQSIIIKQNSNIIEMLELFQEGDKINGTDDERDIESNNSSS